MFDNKIETPKVILVCVDTEEFDVDKSLDELEELVKTAGAEVAARVTQKRPTMDKTTCVGSGKIKEIAELCAQLEPDQIIFDHDLTATQIRNIEEVAKVYTIDRTMLILDIFAQRASSKEGRLQVELAQQRYRLPRLAGMGINLSRLGGGIGTRGPGETKLETDKRYIRTRIEILQAELKEIEKRRELSRVRRKKDNVLIAAIVGYTNVGKSTLLNTLTQAGVLAENKLFATLDTTSRSLELPDGRSVLLVDTVGLIRRLPHHLVEAFKSTLEEAANSDVILHICDASADDVDEQAQVTLDMLTELGCKDIPIITVFNKCDVATHATEIENSDLTVKISAKDGTGLDELLISIAKALPQSSYRMKMILPYDKAGILNKIREDGKIYSEEYVTDGIAVDALVDVKIFSLVEPFKVNNIN